MRFSIEQFAPHLAASEAPKRTAARKGYHQKREADSSQSAQDLLHCPVVKHVFVSSAASLAEPGWLALATLLSKCDDGRDFMHEWSAPYPGYDPAEADAKFDHAAKYGPVTCKRMAEELGGSQHCSGCPYAGKIRSPIQLTDPVARLASRYVFVVSTRMFYDLETGPSLTKDQFSDVYSVEIPNGQAARKVLNHPNLLKVHDLTYAPCQPRIIERDDDKYLNVWVDDCCKSADGDPSIFLAHLSYLIPDASERTHFVRWMAYLVQNPGERPLHGILLTGKQGTGKSTLGRWLKQILGPSNCAEVSTEELHSEFVDWLEGKSLVIIEELMASGRVELGNKLKPIFTAQTLRINVKYQRPREIEVKAGILAFSNHPHAVHLEPGDRRWFVIHSPAEPKEPGYYGPVAEADAGIFRRYLETIGLSGFNPAAPPPMTAAKAEMTEDSRTPLEWIIRHMLAEGAYPFDADVVTLEAVLQAVRQDAPKATTQAVLGALKGLGAVKLPRVRLGQGVQASPWAVRRPELWLQATPEAIREALQGQRRVA